MNSYYIYTRKTDLDVSSWPTNWPEKVLPQSQITIGGVSPSKIFGRCIYRVVATDLREEADIEVFSEQCGQSIIGHVTLLYSIPLSSPANRRERRVEVPLNSTLTIFAAPVLRFVVPSFAMQ